MILNDNHGNSPFLTHYLQNELIVGNVDLLSSEKSIHRLLLLMDMTEREDEHLEHPNPLEISNSQKLYQMCQLPL